MARYRGARARAWYAGRQRVGHGVDLKRAMARNIRVARKAQALSQLGPAEQNELSADFIGRVDGGTTSPSIESLKAVASAMNVLLGGLFTWELQVDAPQEALIELIGLCRGCTREGIGRPVKIAHLVLVRQ